MRIGLLIGAPSAALALLWSCSISPSSSAQVMSVEPAFAYQGEATEVTITGEGFALRASRDVSCGGAPLMVDDGFEGTLGDETLEEVVWVDARTLTARVPGTLAVGFHDLVVTTPSGDSVALPDAFEVRGSGGDLDSDSDSDTDIDTDADTDPDTDTDSDTDSDTGSDAVVGDGIECDSAMVIDSFPFTWDSVWVDFYSSFAPTNACGAGNSDVWFVVQIPGGGVTLRVSELSDTNVIVRHVASCTDWSCVDYSDWPEYLDIAGGSTAESVYVVVTEIDAAFHPNGTVQFQILE
jgi:hypothetical protein